MSDKHYIGGAASEEFAAFMVKLAAAWDHRLSAPRIVWYARLLDGIPIETLERVGAQLADESRFFPSVAEIKDRLRVRAEDAAVLAWVALERAAAEVGAWRTVVVEDAAAGLALGQVCGSWPEFCALEDGPQRAIRRQEFLAAYRQHRQAPVSRPVQLPGLAALQGDDAGETARLLPDGRTAHSLPRAHASGLLAE